MPKRSAGLLLFKRGPDGLLVLLAHPGGPFWAKRDKGAWSIPKGEIEPGEDPRATAFREFAEETGRSLDRTATLLDLGQITQKAGKVVLCYGLEGDLDPAAITSALVDVEWPPRSGRRLTFPEIDRVEWFPLAAARTSILPSQAVFVDRLEASAARFRP